MSNWHPWVAALVVASLAAACSESERPPGSPSARPRLADEQPGAEAGSKGRDKQGAATPQTDAPVATPNEAVGKGPLIDARYALSATGPALGCTGSARMLLTGSPLATAAKTLVPRMEFPEGKAACGLLTFDLTRLMGGFIAIGRASEAPVVEGAVIRLKHLGQASFDPPRPLLPSLLAAAKEDLARIDTTVTTKIRDEQDGATATGRISVRTLGAGESLRSEAMQRTFSRVLRFEVVHAGFAGVSKVRNFLFERIVFHVSLDPLAMVRVEFKGTVADLLAASSDAPQGTGDDATKDDSTLASDPLAGAAGAFFGDQIVEVRLDLREQAGLAAATADDD